MKPAEHFNQAVSDINTVHASLDTIQSLLERDGMTGLALLLDGPRQRLKGAMATLLDQAPMIEECFEGFQKLEGKE